VSRANDTLAYCQDLYRQGEKKPKYTDLSQRLTQLKKTTEKVWLTEVSSILLQQSLRDLETAFSNFFASCKEKRKGRKVKPPKFKKRKSKQSARFTNNGFTVRNAPPLSSQISNPVGSGVNQNHVTLAKIGDLKVVWSRPLPSEPSSVTIIKDAADRYFRRSFRDMLSAKSDKYGRDFRLISRWEPTSQRCSCCGNIGGKKALNVREWECLFCGTFHDRDVNAAINIKVAGGLSDTQNGRGGKRQTSVKEAASREASTHQKYEQLSLF
jgi:transposase